MSSANALDPQRLRRELLLQQAIERRLDELVRLANLTAAMLEKSSMEKSQLRNLLNVATTTSSPEVVINFIRYQIARENDKGNKWGKDQNSFGHTLIKRLGKEVRDWAATVTQEVNAHMPNEPSDALYSAAYIQLIRLFIGYLNRAFYYGKEVEDGFNQLQELANA
ncbi:hypothetical protein [Chloroflexus sp.]|uniref:hypothetical protein n=1 Tax=Chloroflexus sp. TaxID=1904827 RepID=UPI002ACDEF7D|nr:hypothetical protein [Chloroflexus sp.]